MKNGEKKIPNAKVDGFAIPLEDGVDHVFHLDASASYELDPDFVFVVGCDGEEFEITGREVFEGLRELGEAVRARQAKREEPR